MLPGEPVEVPASPSQSLPVSALKRHRGRRWEEHPLGKNHAATTMPETQRQSDDARASPALSDVQRNSGLNFVISMRARLPKIRIATLNIGMLTAKSREIADMMERRSIDILCLQETRCTGGKSDESLTSTSYWLLLVVQ